MTDDEPKAMETREPKGNGSFTSEEMRKAFGPHPMADFKPVIRRKRRRR